MDEIRRLDSIREILFAIEMLKSGYELWGGWTKFHVRYAKEGERAVDKYSHADEAAWAYARLLGGVAYNISSLGLAWRRA